MLHKSMFFLRLSFAVSAFILAATIGSAQPFYEIDEYRGHVYFEDLLVRGADAMTFRDLGYGYGKDNRNVYRFGKVLEYVDPSSFRVNRNFAPRHEYEWNYDYNYDYDYDYDDDRYDDYFDEEYRGGYRVTSFDVYYRRRKVRDASVMSFRVLGLGYAMDAFNVYWRGHKIEDASVYSFKVLGDGYAKDAFNMYYMGREVDDVPMRYR